MTTLDKQNAATLARIERSLESPPEPRALRNRRALVIRRNHCGEAMAPGLVCGRELDHDGAHGHCVSERTVEVEVVCGVEEVEGDAYPLDECGFRCGPAYPWPLDQGDQEEVDYLAHEREADDYERALEDRADAARERDL